MKTFSNSKSSQGESTVVKYLLITTAVLFLGLMLVVPLFTVFVEAFRKGFEAYFTVLIEIFWSKERIMEVYLNSIEMGNGVYGAQAATKHWYQKDCKSLTKNEAAGIAVILPNPRKYKATGTTVYISRRKAKISKYLGYVKLEY